MASLPPVAMSRRHLLGGLAALPALTALPGVGTAQAQDAPLPSWNDGAAKSAIQDFVARVTSEGGAAFVPAPERIAVFDNDGTLWCEKPYYAQLQFVLDRVRALAPEHPEWREKQPFKAVLENDLAAAMAGGEEGALRLVMATHAGTTVEEFSALVSDWLAKARHPRFHRPYNSLVYQPMLELLAYLRGNGFETWICSGGGIEFMRPWAPEAYGIPPQQIIGSSIKTTYELHDGEPALVRQPEIEFIDDKAGKPVGINRFVGRRPIAAFGNSDGDRQMLEWTTAGSGARFGMLVLHDDAEREYAYGPANGLPASHVGTFTQGLMDEAKKLDWPVISMKNDWKRVFPFKS